MKKLMCRGTVNFARTRRQITKYNDIIAIMAGRNLPYTPHVAKYVRFAAIEMSVKEWNLEREALLMTKSNELKKQWDLIADSFPDFSPTQIKNKYYKLLKRDRNRQARLLKQSIERILGEIH